VRTEYAVVGGGLVGMAIAYGLTRRGKQVTVLDEGDVALRASRGNFGLVWVQGKGADMPDYARWTRRAAALWPGFAEELRAVTGVDIELSQPGGLDFCLSDEDAERTVARLEGLRAALGGDYPFEYLGHNALRERVPQIGPDVAGAVYCPEDGHVNPLYLLRALHAGVRATGGRVEAGGPVRRIESTGAGFRIDHVHQWQADHIVLCAGLGNAALAPMVGLEAQVEPLRGQVVICERVKPFLHYPSVQIRQVGEGAVQIGDSKENVGFDDGTTARVICDIARRAVRIFPLLRDVRVVRTWGSLRVMSADGYPIYDQSFDCPSAWVVTCHSGVTLAAGHALVVAGAIATGAPLDHLESFSGKRFRLHSAA
jgi:glycine/D-amino acid oxidase-like deaminating enzyme